MEAIKCPVCGTAGEIMRNDDAVEQLNRKLYHLAERFCNFTEGELERLTAYEKIELALARLSGSVEAVKDQRDQLEAVQKCNSWAPKAELEEWKARADKSEAAAKSALEDMLRERDRAIAAEKACADMREAARCANCNNRATCVGRYEDSNGPLEFACDTCCGHGNEDGHCHRLTDCGKDWVPEAEFGPASGVSTWTSEQDS